MFLCNYPSHGSLFLHFTQTLFSYFLSFLFVSFIACFHGRLLGFSKSLCFLSHELCLLVCLEPLHFISLVVSVLLFSTVALWMYCNCPRSKISVLGSCTVTSLLCDHLCLAGKAGQL